MARRRRPTRRAISRIEFEPRCQRSIAECELAVFLSIGSKLASYFVAIITETGAGFSTKKASMCWRGADMSAPLNAEQHVMLGLANFTCQYAAPKGARKSHPHLAPRGVYDLSASALGEATAAPTSFGGGFRSAFRFFTGAASGFLGFGVALLTFSPSSRPSFLPARGSDWISLSSDCERALQDLDRGVSDPVRSCARIGRSRP